MVLIAKQTQGRVPSAVFEPSGFRELPADILSAVAPQDWATLRLHLHPAARLLHSPFPISRIWLSNQPHAEPEVIDLQSGAERLLVYCARNGLELHRLRSGEYALAQALATELTLADALSQTQLEAPECDLAQALNRLFACGALIVNYEESSAHEND